GVPLLLAGAKGSMAFDLEGAVRRLGLDGWVRHLGYLPEADVTGVLANATCFVYPSLFEGFGLPPLEAMVCGAAVVVSDATCLPEVVGDAGLVARHADSAHLAEQIGAVVGDRDLRLELVRRGTERAASF